MELESPVSDAPSPAVQGRRISASLPACLLGDILRCANAGDDIFALGVDEKLAI